MNFQEFWKQVFRSHRKALRKNFVYLKLKCSNFGISSVKNSESIFHSPQRLAQPGPREGVRVRQGDGPARDLEGLAQGREVRGPGAAAGAADGEGSPRGQQALGQAGVGDPALQDVHGLVLETKIESRKEREK